MSPTSYLTAPPRVAAENIATPAFSSPGFSVVGRHLGDAFACDLVGGFGVRLAPVRRDRLDQLVLGLAARVCSALAVDYKGHLDPPFARVDADSGSGQHFGQGFEQ